MSPIFQEAGRYHHCVRCSLRFRNTVHGRKRAKSSVGSENHDDKRSTESEGNGCNGEQTGSKTGASSGLERENKAAAAEFFGKTAFVAKRVEW